MHFYILLFALKDNEQTKSSVTNEIKPWSLKSRYAAQEDVLQEFKKSNVNSLLSEEDLGFYIQDLFDRDRYNL